MSLVVAEKKTPHGLLIVITGQDLLGKRFEEGKLQLDVQEGFHQGTVKTKEEIKELLPTARHIHATGKEAVAILIELDLVENDRILWIAGVPHAQAFRE